MESLQTLSELQGLIPYLQSHEIAEIDQLLTEGKPWMPLSGPQSLAYYSSADILYYGGSAGGGKSGLLLGLALTAHSRSIIFRREGTQLEGLVDDLKRIVGHTTGWNGQKNIMRLPGHQIEFGSCKDLGSEQAYQGRAHTLKCFDEIPHFAEKQFRFLCGWLRPMGGDPNERCRVVGAGNPPLTAEERWVIKFWAPWLDTDKYPTPAVPGELRWFTTIKGEDVECPNGDPILMDGMWITPKSRTFLPSSVKDNPFLMAAGYESTLAALPEPLRSQMLLGDFTAGTEDNPYQVIPTAWVDAAMKRWQRREPKGPMDSMGVDVARGGRDDEVYARRHGNWFDQLVVHPGSATPDGPTTASRVMLLLRDAAPIHIDIVGWGASPYDLLKGAGVQTIGVNNGAGSTERAKGSGLAFFNVRAQDWWRMREALDPVNDMAVELPPDPELKADLCAPTWEPTVRGIKLESKEDIRERIGRSPGRGDAIVLANRITPKLNGANGGWSFKRPASAKIVCNP